MTWSFLLEGALKKEKKKISAKGGEGGVENLSADPGMPNEQDETYQQKLFENDLYIWSLLLLRNNDI